MSDKYRLTTPHIAALATALGLVLGSPGVTLAESACKGLSEQVCAANTACIWASGYTRKDGVTVAAYCRAKGASQGAESPAVQAPKAPAATAPAATQKATGAAVKAGEPATTATQKGTGAAAKAGESATTTTQKATGAAAKTGKSATTATQKASDAATQAKDAASGLSTQPAVTPKP